MLAHADQGGGVVDQLLPYALWCVVAVYLAVYVVLLAHARRRGIRIGYGHVLAYVAALAVIPFAAIRLDAWSDSTAVGHMVQHELLLNVAPVLLLSGIPRRAATIASKPLSGRVVRSRAGHAVLDVISRPIVALAVYASGMGAWLVPAVNRAVEGSELLHSALHIWLTASGLAFWFHVVRPLPSLHPLRTAETLAYLLCGAAVGAVVAALLIASPDVITSSEAAAADALSEQHLAGGVMMAMEMPLVLGFAVWIWLRETGTQARAGMRSPRRWLGI